MNEKKLIVVLGMHRSGTSAITRGLQLLGVGLGGNLYPAASDNPKGFWEDLDCLEINEALLGYLGSAYDRLDFAWEKIGKNAEINRLKLRASQLITRKLHEGNGIWGFKDPRTCRLLSFWQEVFQAVGCDTRYVIAVRNPLSVVESLENRNALPAEKSYLLWLQHTLPSVLQTQGKKRVLVDYDKLMDSPYLQISRVATALELPIPEQDSRLVVEFEQGFLDQDLRHSRYSLAELRIDNRMPSAVAAVYELLSSVAGEMSNFSPSLTEQLELLNAGLVNLSPLFDYVNRLEATRTELWKSIAEHQLHSSNLNDALGDRDKEIVGLSESLAVCSEQLTDRDEQIVGKRPPNSPCVIQAGAH